MKRLLMIMLLGIFMLSFANAAEFDNAISDYNEDGEIITFRNGCVLGQGWTCVGSEIGKVKLITPKNLRVAAGYNYVWEMEVEVNEDYNDFLKGFEFEDMANGKQKINRDLDIKMFKGMVNVSKNINGCLENGLSENGTSICLDYGAIGTRLVEEENWEKVTPADIKQADGKVRLRGYTDVQVGDHVDWSPLIFGVRVPHEIWAEWTQDLNTDIISYWKMDNTTGVVYDMLQLNDGTNTGATRGVTGKIGNAFDFDGSNDRVDIANSASLDIGTGSFTLAYWFKTSAAGPAEIVAKGESGGSARRWFTTINGAEGIDFSLGDGGGVVTTTTAGTFNDGAWHFLVAKRDTSNDTMYLFLDNVLEDTDSSPTGNITEPTVPLRLGAVPYSLTRFFNGEIDEIGIWDRALSPSEIIQLWNEGNGITYTNVFGTAPSVTLVSPVDDANLTSANVDFIATVTDDQEVENVTLFLDGVANETNSSSFNGTYTFSKTVSEGVHNWSILAYDNASLSNQSETRTFNYTQPPISIELTSPTDASTHVSPPVNVSCNAFEDIGVTQLNLTINSVVNITVENTTVAENLSISEIINFSEGNYTWGCSAKNDMTSAVSANRTFEVLYSNPVINLFSPENNSNIISATATFIFNASDINGLQNVTLFLDGVANETNSSGFEGNYTFVKNFTSGFHNWSARAVSTLGKITDSETRDFTIHFDVPNVTITAPSGTISQFTVGGNETLNYSITETGENSSHFDECWYVYSSDEVLNNTSNFSAASRWNVKNGTMSESNGENVIRTGLTLPSGIYSISAISSTNTLRVSSFTEDIQDCFNAGYTVQATISADREGYYSCARNEDSEYFLIKLVNFSGTESVFNSYEITNDLNCSDTSTEFLYENGVNDITVFATDEFGLTGNATSNWTYNVLEVSQTFNNETIEGLTETFSANITTSLAVSTATLVYDGTEYLGTLELTDTNDYTVSASIVIPGVTGDENKTFFWEIVLSDASEFNLTSNNITVQDIAIDDCTVGSIVIMNLSLFDEEFQTVLNGTIEVDLDLFSSDGTAISTFSQNYTNVTNAPVCITNVSTDILDYLVTALIGYGSTGYAEEFYNIQKATIDNSTIPINISLYGLDDDDATTFVMSYKGVDFLPLVGSLFNVQRRYISEGVFKSVEVVESDDEGFAKAHFDTEGVIYRITITQDGEIIDTFDNVKVACDNVITEDCQVNLNSFSSQTDFTEWKQFGDITFVQEFDSSTRTKTVSYNTVDGSPANITVTLVTADGSSEQLCSSSLFSSAGVITCVVPLSFGNGTVVSTISTNDINILSELDVITSNPGEQFGVDAYVFAFIMVISFPLIMVGSAIGVMFGLLFGALAAFMLLLADNTGLLGPTAALTWLLVALGILVYKMFRRER